MPIAKVPGESNPADLMTKNLGLKNIDKNVEFMQMTFSDGRAAKAAQLHTMDDALESEPNIAWKAMQDKSNDQQGGDRWKIRGKAGTWHWLHSTPRRSLFTPYKVAKGPGQGVKLNQTRFTKGITQSGRSFEFHDDWSIPLNAHRVLEEPWIGSTMFVEEHKSTLHDIQMKRQDRGRAAEAEVQGSSIRRAVWADMVE